MYTLCEEHADCKDPSCDYLHDNQWDVNASPMWLIDGVTFSADGDDEGPQHPKAEEHKCQSENGELSPTTSMVSPNT